MNTECDDAICRPSPHFSNSGKKNVVRVIKRQPPCANVSLSRGTIKFVEQALQLGVLEFLA
jgi:hypothetical protein